MSLLIPGERVDQATDRRQDRPRRWRRQIGVRSCCPLHQRHEARDRCGGVVSRPGVVGVGAFGVGGDAGEVVEGVGEGAVAFVDGAVVAVGSAAIGSATVGLGVSNRGAKPAEETAAGKAFGTALEEVPPSQGSGSPTADPRNRAEEPFAGNRSAKAVIPSVALELSPITRARSSRNRLGSFSGNSVKRNQVAPRNSETSGESPANSPGAGAAPSQESRLPVVACRKRFINTAVRLAPSS